MRRLCTTLYTETNFARVENGGWGNARVFFGATSVRYDLLKAVRPVRESLYDDRNERTIRRCEFVTLAPNDETRYDAVDDEVRLEIALLSRCKCSCEKSLATVNLLTIGEGRKKLDDSTISLCTTRVKKGMIKAK